MPTPSSYCPYQVSTSYTLRFPRYNQTWGDYFEKYSNTITNNFNFHDYEYDYDYTIFKSIRLRLWLLFWKVFDYIYEYTTITFEKIKFI